jgi:hypothetical protein
MVEAVARTPIPLRWNDFAFRMGDTQSHRAWPIAWMIHGPGGNGKPELDYRTRPYIQHVIGVARIGLVDWYLDSPRKRAFESMGYSADEKCAIDLLHDTVESAIRHDDPLRRMSPQQVYALMAERGLNDRVIAGVKSLTFIPSQPGLSRTELVVEQGQQIAESPLARSLKPDDHEHNTLRSRFYPFLSALHTVHSIWKILNICDIAELPVPHGIRHASQEVRSLEGVQAMLDGDLRRNRPPKEDEGLIHELATAEENAMKTWPIGGLRPALL